MTTKSMTGFARADGSTGPIAWHWELRSVNGRGLDLRLRLPPGFEGLEPRIRETVGKRISRGSLAVNLNVKRGDGATQIQLNEAALGQVLDALERLRKTTGAAPPQAEALLGIKGVLEVVEKEESEEELQARAEAMLTGLGEALDAMVRARETEGGRLRTIILDQLAAIERLVSAIATAPARTPEAIRRRLTEQLARLLDTGTSLDENRLYQEAAMLATRADVEEELQRLGAHVAAARELLDSGEPAGRRLDFLAQEFNREANTLCSKASDPEMTRAGLELKAVIDQMREQVQNIE
ncbi:MAG TPA: YicC/YloC family endoribonuclease [Hyphomicrobiaceae bacterium]|nr:YicC/YloC family endoribonuclease [Hyphomicrobiaceae bacterium]